MEFPSLSSISKDGHSRSFDFHASVSSNAPNGGAQQLQAGKSDILPPLPKGEFHRISGRVFAVLDSVEGKHMTTHLLQCSLETFNALCAEGHADAMGLVQRLAFKTLNSSSIASSLMEEGIETLVVGDCINLSPDEYHALIACIEHGINVVPLAFVYEVIRRQVPLHLLDKDIPLDSFDGTKLRNRAKRVLDIGVSLVGLSFLVLIFPIISILIKLSSPGPVIYSQRRIGLLGEEFNIYKFRTMKVNAESNGAVWASENDDRVTILGKVLRQTRLDEFPQFWNVLIGNMSVVGPRPERPEFVSMLQDEIPHYSSRHAVLPGITGWAQVMFPYGASVQDSYEKLKYDLYYIKNWSIWLDMQIMLRTFCVMIMKIGGR